MSRASVDPSHLLIKLEGVLESDPHIDEVGFIHPTQFAAFNEEVHSSPSSSSAADGSQLEDETSKSETTRNNNYDTCFWHNEHELGISTLVLVQLYRAAKYAFMDSYRRYRMLSNSQINEDGRVDGNASTCSTSFLDIAEIEVMRHSRALLLLSCDFGSAWNSRKLIVSRKLLLPMFMDELLLSTLVISYSPKSEHAWSHGRWVIKMIAGKCANLPEIVERESELVKKIIEVIDNLRCNKDSGVFLGGELCRIWKEELDWDAILIRQYVGRESSMFLKDEIMLFQSCTIIPDNEFGDYQAQTAFSATYITWLVKQMPMAFGVALRESSEFETLKLLLEQNGKSCLWDSLNASCAST